MGDFQSRLVFLENEIKPYAFFPAEANIEYHAALDKGIFKIFHRLNTKVQKSCVCCPNLLISAIG